jgi:hypothetical protein
LVELWVEVTARLSLKKVSTQNNFQLIDLYTRQGRQESVAM